MRYQIDIQQWLESKSSLFGEVNAATWPNVRVNCPYCGDTKQRFYVTVEDYGEKKQGWGWCQNTQEAHHFYRLYQDFENLTDAETYNRLFSADKEPLYGKVGDFLAEYYAKQQGAAKLEGQALPVVWPTGYVPLYGLSPEEWVKNTPAYMIKRQLTQDLCNQYYLGFCKSGHEYGGRVIVPIYQFGKLVGFQGRAMHDGIKPKYRFMDGISAGDFLFNLDNVLGSKEIVLVEGVFDVWGTKRAGFHNVAASFGKHLTAKGIKTLIKNFKRVVLFWDMDALPEIVKLADSLMGLIEVFVTTLAGKDPDEATPVEVAKAIMEAEPYSKSFKRRVFIATYSKQKI